MFTPIVFIFLIAVILGVYFIAKAKSKSDKSNGDVQQGTESTSVQRNEV